MSTEERGARSAGEQLPLIKKLGLDVYGLHIGNYYVRAYELEQLLEKAVRVYGDESLWGERLNPVDTHTALLINIEPIQKDTAESLLRELVDAGPAKKEIFWEIQDRARKLLEQK